LKKVVQFKIKNIFAIIISIIILPIIFLTNNCSQTDEVGLASYEISEEFSGAVIGQLLTVDDFGIAFGLASDPGNPNMFLRVHFYINGPYGSGSYIGSALANYDNGLGNPHYFRFQIPNNVTSGQPQLIYAYGHDPKFNRLLVGSPGTYIGLIPKAQNIFNENLASFVVQACSNCHSWDYQSLYYGPLTNPRPGQGGSATNNTFINKMNGGGHGGGRFCNSNSDFPCSDIQRWWQAEFN